MADEHQRQTAPSLKQPPLEYAQMGRVFCSIDFSEGAGLTKATLDLLGDHVLMFASDYPHPETIFPDHADTVLAWRRDLGEPAMQKLMWETLLPVDVHAVERPSIAERLVWIPVSVREH
ncbi:MAG: hypothetical protein ACREKS_13545 [Candidatus Rokuibacteriota bacterium]